MKKLKNWYVLIYFSLLFDFEFHLKKKKIKKGSAIELIKLVCFIVKSLGTQETIQHSDYFDLVLLLHGIV